MTEERKNQDQEGAAMGHDQWWLREGRQDKRPFVEESQRLLTINLMESGV